VCEVDTLESSYVVATYYKTIDKAVLFDEKSIRKAELYVNEIYITD
jgi:hypothetical protein